MLRDTINGKLSCPSKHRDFFKVMRLTLVLEINDKFHILIFFAQVPVV